jgi:hypothetical protein
MKTAVLLTGKITGTENLENHIKEVFAPYHADVFVDSWIPFPKNSMATTALRSEQIMDRVINGKEKPENVFRELIAGGMNVDEAQRTVEEIFGTDPKIDLIEFANGYQPKMLNLEYFDSVPLVHQVRALRKLRGNTISKKSIMGIESTNTKIENVIFMWYKIWKCNELRKVYERTHKVRYDRVIRMRFDNTFEGLPVIEPLPKTVYVPKGGDYMGGLCDQFAIADSQTMDLYCDLYNEIYRYIVVGFGIHPESLLRKHLEVNRLNLIRLDCNMLLRGKIQPTEGVY